MDKSTIAGIAGGMLLIVGSIILIGGVGGIGMFIDIPSLVIVVGGAIAGAMVSFPFHYISTALNAVKLMFGGGEGYELEEPIKLLVGLSKKVRTEGLLSIEQDVNEIEDDFLRGSFQMVIDGTEANALEMVMEEEIKALENRHDVGIAVFQTMGGLAPGFGMIGTLIGLVFLLSNLDDPSMIGPSMSAAMLTTLYGSLFANLIFSPLSSKLDVMTQKELTRMRMAKSAILMINSGENPRMIERNLLIFLSPDQRRKFEEEAVGA